MSNKKTTVNDTSIAEILKKMKKLSEYNDTLIELIRSNQLTLSYYHRIIDHYICNSTGASCNYTAHREIYDATGFYDKTVKVCSSCGEEEIIKP